MNTELNIKQEDPWFIIEKHHIDDLVNPELGMTVIDYSRDHTSFHYQTCAHELRSDWGALHNGFTKAVSSSLVSNYWYKCLDSKENSENSWWRLFSSRIAHELNEQLDGRGLSFEPIAFDDLYLTLYEPSEIGVGPHRDTNCKGVVVTLILEGSAFFSVCKEKDMSGSISVEVPWNSLVITRAAGFCGLERPIHYVGRVSPHTMLQFGMRQYINPPKKGE